MTAPLMQRAASSPARQKAPVIQPSPLPQVLTEQLFDLIEHCLTCNLYACPDCQRLSQVSEILLRPFQSRRPL